MIIKKIAIEEFSSYCIDEDGNVLNKEGAYLEPSFNDRGYLKITLCSNGRRKQYSVHRLVALTFIPNPENKKWINHKDSNPINNSVINLEWCTPSENVKHAWTSKNREGLILSSRKNISRNREKAYVKTRKVVVQLDINGNIIKEYGSIVDAAKSVKTPATNITSVLRGKTFTAGGFKWKYKA